MSYHSRTVLNSLRVIVSDSETPISFTYNPNETLLVARGGKAYDYAEFKDQIEGIILYLAQGGYVEPINKTSFRLTHKGLHPYRVGWDQLRGFLFKSLLVPIVVAIITSIITNVAIGLL